MIYDKDTGPLDMFGRVITDGALLAVGTNSGIRLGRVIAVKTSERTSYWDVQTPKVIGYEYSITIDKYHGAKKRQTFGHDNLGEEKFWIVDLDDDGIPVLP